MMLGLTFAALLHLQAATLTVGPGGAFATISVAIAAAAPGDTIRVAPGVYHEHAVIEQALVLLGEPGAVIDGDGQGTVLSISAPAVVRGFTIRRSGSDQYLEHAGILAIAADRLVVEENRFEDVLFGVYVKQSDRVIIRRNEIEGKDLAIPLRGDGIRLWYSHNGIIEANRVTRTRDVVIWFSNGTHVRGNRVHDGRYGLHYMYSNQNVFEGNEFSANHVGAFIMYSDDIAFRNNVFADARGTTGRGLGFKDSERITAEDNVLVKNAVGISIDNSPHNRGVENHFRNNLIAYNDVAVTMLPSVHSNVFTGNDFVDNVQTVAVSGGGTALANTWRGNYWSDYAGFDTNGDGYGDTPFVFERLSNDLLASHEDLRVFTLSPALRVLNILSQVLPFLAPQPIVADSHPRIGHANLERGAEPAPGGHKGVVAGFLLAATGAATMAVVLRRAPRWPQ